MEEQKKTILIVEDDPFLTKLYQTKLEREGYNTICLTKGDGALERCKAEKPNLVLLDLILPGLSGYEVLTALKQDPETKDIPVLILSNLGQEEDMSRGLNLGAVDYIIKANISTGGVIETIKKYIQ